MFEKQKLDGGRNNSLSNKHQDSTDNETMEEFFKVLIEMKIIAS